MSNARWDPFRNVATLQDRINRLFDDSFPEATESGETSMCAWKPLVDIYRAEDGIVLKAELPGVSKQDVTLEIDDNVLTIRGERQPDAQISDDQYFRRERCCGTFHRAFNLQQQVNPKRISARFKDGILEVTIPRPERERPKQIKVDID